MKEMIENLKQDEKELENKIQRRGAELDRSEKRLKNIEKIRPEFMDEYEKLEQEIEKFYSIYIEKFRNLDYLENQLDKYNEKELEKKKENEKSLRKIQEKYKMEEFKIINEGNEDANLMNEMGSTRTGFNNQPFKNFNKQGNKVTGNIEGDDDEDEDAEGEISEDEDGEPISLGSDEEIDEDGSDQNL